VVIFHTKKRTELPKMALDENEKAIADGAALDESSKEVLLDDVVELMQIAENDPSSQGKQTKAFHFNIQFGKKFVKFSLQSGNQIKSTI